MKEEEISKRGRVTVTIELERVGSESYTENRIASALSRREVVLELPSLADEQTRRELGDLVASAAAETMEKVYATLDDQHRLALKAREAGLEETARIAKEDPPF